MKKASERMLLSLNGAWSLYYAPEKGGHSDAYRPGMEKEWDRVPAQVPGNAELDLVAAGVEEDPFYDENLYHFAKYEYYQWLYVREFTAPKAYGRTILRFEGVDTIADVYLNGEHLGRTENMFITHEFDVTALIRPEAENRLAVHIHSAMNFVRSKDYPIGMRGTAHRNEICWIRKAPHSFGWDIMPRLVTSGLWKDVSLRSVSQTRLTETYYATSGYDRASDTATLQFAFRFVTDADTLEGFSVRLTGECEDTRFVEERPVWFVSHNETMEIPAPKLWWPIGYGEQPLYTMTLELLRYGEVVDRCTESVGLRTFRLERSFELGNQRFQMYVNDVPIMVRGTNWVPLDAMHSRDAQRLERAFELVRDCGCNMVRCWGGNVYESDRFFELCDENGVMVWQDFALGNTNYPQDDAFAAVIEREATAVIRRLRNHPSLVLWSGDNEIDLKNCGFQLPHYDARYNRIAHETLVRALQAHDPYRFFVRSSPEIPEGFDTTNVPEQHTWGPRAFFKDDFYKNSSASFIGEAGYQGCPAPSSIRTFIAPDKVWPMHNRAWAMHSTEDVRIESTLNSRNLLTANQLKLLCADEPDGLEEFAVLSQISQAEALKFFIEHTRCLKGRRSGILWWNMIDGWPQISDAVVDYYFRKKIGFHYARRSGRPWLVMMDEVQGWRQDVVLCNDTRQKVRFDWSVEDGDSAEVFASGSCEVEAGENRRVSALKVDPSAQRLLIIRYEVDGQRFANHYLTGFPKYRKADLLRWQKIVAALPEPFELEM